MRLAVTGLTGQVVSSMISRAPTEVEIIALGRPQFELARRDAILSSLKAIKCDAIINAAAYTAVDNAEREPDVAMRINGDGAGFVAEAAAALNIPLVHLSTDYVFDGGLDRPYCEDDQTGPKCVYGRSKFEGEQRIAEIHANHVILRTAWVYSNFGSNFIKTMLKLGKIKSEISVVSDQIGNPTYAQDIADALFLVARRLVSDSDMKLRGIFHMTGEGEATWADLAEYIFFLAERQGYPHVIVNRIYTEHYPTPACRPKNSRLDNKKFRETYCLSLPSWQLSVEDCVGKILTETTGY